MPAVSAESRARFEAIHSRGAHLRGLYRRAVFLLALASAALTFLASRISPDVGPFPGTIPLTWTITLLLVATLALLTFDAGRWGKVEREWPPDGADARGIADRVSRASTAAAVVMTSAFAIDDRYRHLLSTARRARGGASAERDRWEEEVVPLRPVLVPLVGAVWIGVSLVEAAAYINPSGIVFVVPVVLYLVALWRGKARLERRYPVDAPLKLLTLRVFSSPGLNDFVLMTDGWRWLGPMQRLDGSDTAGSSLRDVVAYVRGNVEDVIVEDDAELADALARFHADPDGQLRYPLNSMQCNDATWKQALQTMLDDADAVVMDLSGFNEQRRGCAYEIGKLVGEVPLRRFVLLVNEDTDQEYLRRVLRDAWASMPESSPNAATQDPVHLLEVPAETAEVDRDRLVGALRDAASAARDAPAARVLPWARPGLPRLCAFL